MIIAIIFMYEEFMECIECLSNLCKVGFNVKVILFYFILFFLNSISTADYSNENEKYVFF